MRLRPLLNVPLASVLFVGLQIAAVSFPTAVAQGQEPSVSAERERGISFFKQKRSREAIASLQQAVKKNRQDYEAWYYLGLAQSQKNDLKNATKSFETAAKLKPNSTEAHNQLALTLLLRNKLSDAIREAQATLNIDPRLPNPHYFIGAARLRMDARDEALVQAETAIKLDPGYPFGYLLKSQALVSFRGDVLVSDPKTSAEEDRERYRLAATALERYLQLEPDSENKQTWVEQLESLKVYSNPRQVNGVDEIHFAREVTERARVLSKPEPGYTEAARVGGIEGTVVLRVIFAADGKVKHILVIKGLPKGLTEEAIKVARKIKFIPATKDGRLVSVFMQLEYSFNLY
jgi:TonB family protein